MGMRHGFRSVSASQRLPTVVWALAGLCSVFAAWSCSPPPPKGNLQYIEQDTFRIENPSADRAVATGIGCGFTFGEAEQAARDTSSFNLRRVTGSTRYRIEFSRLSETVQSNKVCVEVQAKAVPPRLN